jgi:hypothetical protein
MKTCGQATWLWIGFEPLRRKVIGMERGTDGTYPAFPNDARPDILYFNSRIRSCRNCRSGSCWVRASAFS